MRHRGCFLSLHNGYYICVDGKVYPKELQKFEINGKAPRSFDELKACVNEVWNYGDGGIVYIEKEEIHACHVLDDELVTEFVDYAERRRTKHIGLVPDMEV